MLVLLGVVCCGILSARAQVPGFNSVPGSNLLIGAGGQIYMAIGTDGSFSIGTTTPGSGYNDVSLGTSASVNGAGVLNIDTTGTVSLINNIISLGTTTPLNWAMCGESCWGSGAPATVTIQQSASNGYSVPFIISQTISDDYATFIGFENSSVVNNPQNQTSVPLAWVAGIDNPNQAWGNLANIFFIGNNIPVPGWCCGNTAEPLTIDPAGNFVIWGEGPRCNFVPNGPVHCNPAPSTFEVGGQVAIGQGGGGTWGAGINPAPWYESLLVAGPVALGTSLPEFADTQLTVASSVPGATAWLTLPYDATQGGPTINQVPYLGFLSASGSTWYGIAQEDSATGGELQIPYLFYIDSQGHVSIQFEVLVNALDVPWDMSIGLPAALHTAPIGYWGGMVIGGPVGIGTSNIQGYMLYVQGSAVMVGGTYGSSDSRLKKDIEPYPDRALDVVDKLKPVTFAWKTPLDRGMRGRHIGFIAQDVMPIVPEAVTISDDQEQTLGLKYHSLIPVLAKALQELKATNQALHAQYNELQADQAALERSLHGQKAGE